MQQSDNLMLTVYCGVGKVHLRSADAVPAAQGSEVMATTVSNLGGWTWKTFWLTH